MDFWLLGGRTQTQEVLHNSKFTFASASCYEVMQILTPENLKNSECLEN